MIRRSALLCIVVACGLMIGPGACSPSRSVSLFVPNLFAVRVLPPSGGGELTIDPGGSLVIQVELTMGVNVSGNSIETILDESTLPPDVDLDLGQLFLMDLPDLAARQSATVSYTLFADPTAAPGMYEVTIDSFAEITVEGATESDSQQESVVFTLIVAGPDSNIPSNDDAAESCVQFVNHYNSLPCIPEPLTVAGSCSDSITEFCPDEAAFNACRIENTVCDGPELIENVAPCFELCN